MSTPMANMPIVQPRPLVKAGVAGVALFISLALHVAQFSQIMNAVRWLARTTSRDATPDEVEQVLCTIDAAASWLPLRIACLERSLTMTYQPLLTISGCHCPRRSRA